MTNLDLAQPVEAAEKLFRVISAKHGNQAGARRYGQAMAHLHRLAGTAPIVGLTPDEVEGFYRCLMRPTLTKGE